MRDLRFEVDLLKEKGGCKDDPDFQKINPANYIDFNELMEEEGKEEKTVLLKDSESQNEGFNAKINSVHSE